MDINEFIQRNSRRLIAVAIILFALFSGTLLLSSATAPVELWSASKPLVVGTQLTAQDIKVKSVSMQSGSSRYFSKKANLIGSYITAPVKSGELIPVVAVRKSAVAKAAMREVPLGINKSDLPSNLLAGEFVDIYSVPQKGSATSLLVSHVTIAKIDNQNASMTGSVNVLVTVKPESVLSIADGIQAGRIVLVRHA